MLEIAPSDFYVQMQTLRGVGGRDAADRVRAVGKFGTFFSRELFDTYGGVLARSGRYDVFNPRKKRTLRVPEPEIHLVRTDDGKILRLTRYQGGSKGPVVLHGLGVSSLIFGIDTIETNLLEYLVAAEYDCWLLDYRASVDLPYAHELWTADDVATRDYPAALAKVPSVTRSATVQMLAHCFGATTFSMAMLAGLEGVRSAVISQIATDYVVPWYPQRCLPICAPRRCSISWASTSSTRGRRMRTHFASACSTRFCSSLCRCRARSGRMMPPATASPRSTVGSISLTSSTARR
jgi:cholesterol oxidase